MALIILYLALALQPGCAQDEFEVTSVRLSEDVLVVSGEYFETHCTAVATGEGLIIVDTLETPGATARARELIERFSAEPVRYVINTHVHGDHTWGNQVFDGAILIAHENVAARWDQALAQSRIDPQALAENLRELESALAAAEPGSGEAGDIQLQIAGIRPFTKGLDDLRLIRPTMLFSERMRIRLGDKTVRIEHFGPAHSDSDVVVYVEEENLLLTGDLLLPRMAPYVSADFGGSLCGWIDALQEILERFGEAETVLPGHWGPTDLLAVRTQLERLNAIRDAVAAARAEGLILAEAKRRIELPQLMDLLYYDSMLPLCIEVAWRELQSLQSR